MLENGVFGRLKIVIFFYVGLDTSKCVDREVIRRQRCSGSDNALGLSSVGMRFRLKGELQYRVDTV